MTDEAHLTVYVNKKAVSLPRGFGLEHAVRLYSPRAAEQIRRGTAYIADGAGNPIGEGGGVYDGMAVTVKRYPRPKA